MDAGKIRILLECVEMGSMVKAARKMGYTPSGLAHMMDAVERDIGTKIVERGHYGIRLTPMGKKLHPMLEEFVTLEQNIRKTVQRLDREDAEVIRVGSYSSVARFWMPRIINSFQQAYPRYRVELVVYLRGKCHEALRSGEFHLVLGCREEEDGEHYGFYPLTHDRYMALLPPNSYTSENGSFKVKDFENYPFIVSAQGEGRKNSLLEDILVTNGVHIESYAAYVDDQVAISMVESGLGVTAMPELVLRGNAVELDALPLDPPSYRTIGITYAPEELLSEREKCFLAFIKQYDFR